MKNILVIQTRPGIGDLFIFLPLLKMISDFEKTKINLLTRKRTQADLILSEESNIDKIYYLDDKNKIKKFLYLFKLLKRNQFTKVYIFHNSFFYYVICKLFKIKKVYYYGILKRKTKIFCYAKQKLFEWINLKETGLPNTYFFLDKFIKSNKKKQIVIGIAGSGENKKWSLEKYSELIQKLSKKYLGYKFIVLGGKDQIKDYEVIKNKCDSGINIESFCNYNLQDIIKAISGSELYIGNDTGFMHVCAFLKIPSYGIFGDSPSDYSNYHFLIYPILPTGYKEVNYNDKLMDTITADLVLSNINLKNDN